MSIIQIQRRIAEAGRIRIGQQVAAGRGKKRPTKLETFRLTSPNRARIAEAARLYGGEVAEWEAPAGMQWEVVTKTDVLPVIVPPSDMAFSQFYELWSGGGCQRRCDGATESISDQPCICNPDNRECDIHTRLSVMLRDLTGLGLWRLDTSGYFAALELQGAVDVMRMAAAAGKMLPAALRLEQRQIKRPNETVKRFAVPVLDVEISPAQLLGGGDMRDIGTLSIEPAVAASNERVSAAIQEAERRGLTAVPDTVQERPTPPISEQATKTRERKPRKNAAKAIPPTGIEPRTAAEAAAENAPPPPEDAGPPADDDGPDPRVRLNRKMHALFRDAGIEKDRRDDRLAVTRYLSKNFDIETSNGLTLDQLETVAETLSGWKRGGVLDDKINDLLNQAATDAWQAQQETPQQKENNPT